MKTLIVYFSLEGNTDCAARRIADILGADTLRVYPVKAYPDKGFAKFFWGGKSAVMAETPALEAYAAPLEAYGRVIFGFPVWAGNMAPPIRSFVRENDLSGKRIAAFACQSGLSGHRSPGSAAGADRSEGQAQPGERSKDQGVLRRPGRLNGH